MGASQNANAITMEPMQVGTTKSGYTGAMSSNPAAASSKMLPASFLIQGIAGLGSAYGQASAIEAQGTYQAAQNEVNARYAQMQADDAIRRGDDMATEKMKQARGVVGSQRVAMAANGVVIDSGSAATVQEQTLEIGAKDAQTIRSNAFREALGYKQEAANQSAQAAITRQTAQHTSRNTLLTGGMGAVSNGMQAYHYGKKG